MSSRQLPNYLCATRKRSGLSQAETAHLLGAHGSEKMCRYERFLREPSLKTALALEAVFQKPLKELFAGLYREVEREVAERAKVMSYRKDIKPGRKRDTLNAIINSQVKQ